MKVKELIQKLEWFDEESIIQIYNVNYTDCRFNLHFDIRGLYSDEINRNKAVVIEIKHTGDWVR